ncbi:MAG: hypothetical protein KDD69_16945 [Bdellovibrionales bacterium]|nr:hypothetical protein [Bdellovibrionales bacterium]
MTEQRIEKCREFGVLMALVATLLCGAFLWKEKNVGALVAVFVCSLFVVSAIFAPQVLDTPERLWMAFAERLSVVTTYIVVTLLFYLVITPIALLLRLIGKDLLHLGFDSKAVSYWEPVEPDGPASRPFAPY